ncbi:sigma-54-dependent transcriptional regulator [Rhodovulum sp. DZ06]|uniref:sigma-54-dependent transcriptional regulator n=1 Tax=Rhodovulum sp. DZ06 TaxID=3425126 RepID=UPI003D332732
MTHPAPAPAAGADPAAAAGAPGADDPRILLVDDEAALRESLAQVLDLAGIHADEAGNVDEALAILSPDYPGAVIADMRMPGRDGFALLDAVRALDPDLPVVILTGHGDVPMAVKAMTAGAYDFLEKPCPPARLVEIARRAAEKRRLVQENRALRARIDAAEAGTLEAAILGDAEVTRAYRARLERIAAAGLDVLVLGETGAGKELAARAIHARSDRARGPFVAVNCGALPAEIAGSELFGHEKGAFTGAAARRIGKFEHAEGGTIFLDEIESMPLDLQVKLLRVLQERELERLGGNEAIPLDVRVIAATKPDLKALAEAGKFREDLYYRLDVARVRAPPLRERLEDAPLLFRHFVQQAAERRGRPAPAVEAADLARLSTHDWPGNVRELKNVAERYALGLGLQLGPTGEGAEDAAPPRGLAAQVEAFEKSLLEAALRRSGGRASEAAQALELPRKTFYDKLARHGIKPEAFRG